MSPKALFPALILLLTQIVNSQIVEIKKPTDDSEKLKKEAVAFLRETITDVGNMRSLENRISFASEMAGLMWFHDEKEARAMFAGVVNDFKELLMRYDGQMNSFGVEPGGEEEFYGGFLTGDVTDKARISRKFRTALAVRKQIAQSIAEHDGELAFSFYHDSLNAITNAGFRKQMEDGDRSFEFQLMTQIAETNVAKAAQFGTKSLEKGLSHQHIELLKKIYGKDLDKGIAFGASILSHIKSTKPAAGNHWVMSSLLSFGSENYESSKKPGGKRAVYSQQDLRDIAEVFARAILERSGDEGSSGLEYADEIEKYAPSRAAQIRAKFKTRNSNMNAMSAPPPDYRGPVSTVGIGSNTNTSYGDYANSNAARVKQESEEREKNEKLLMDDVQKLGTNQLPKEDRDKIIVQARKILLQTPGKEKKILGLSTLATQVAKAGDKELAAEIMKDAANLVNSQPKHFQDFLFTLMLTAGYAEADPEKAFPLLEDTIFRANDLISAFVRVAEFIDVAEEMVQDGEVQVGAFGGSMVRGLTTELGVADSTIRTLAKADFTKTKNLTNRFDRAEVRILAKMMILRAVLGGKKEVKSDEEINSPPF